MHLDDEGTEPDPASFGVAFPPRKVRGLARMDRRALGVSRGHPTRTVEAKEKLPESRHMWSDLATGGNVDQMDMRVTDPRSECGTRGANT